MRSAICADRVLLLAGCGGADGTITPASRRTRTSSRRDVADADPDDLEVIEDWSAAAERGRRRGRRRATSRPRAPPRTARPRSDHLDRRRDRLQRFAALRREGDLARTEGELTIADVPAPERPGGDCGSGVGGTASTAFEIEDGKIVDWRRIDRAVPGRRRRRRTSAAGIPAASRDSDRLLAGSKRGIRASVAVPVRLRWARSLLGRTN